MPERFGGGDYRCSFQGQEADKEVKGKGNSVNYKYRMHDARLGRFFAVDPLATQFVYNSPYAFSENDVIRAIELEGAEKWVVNIWRNEDGTILKIMVWRGDASELNKGVKTGIYQTDLGENLKYTDLKGILYRNSSATNGNVTNPKAIPALGYKEADYDESTSTIVNSSTIVGSLMQEEVVVSFGNLKGQSVSYEIAIENKRPIKGNNYVGGITLFYSGLFKANFKHDSYNLEGVELVQAKKAAAIYAGLLVNNPDLTFQVGAHTSTVGSESYNQRLSQNRANALREMIIDYAKSLDSNFDVSRVTAKGYGESSPLVPDQGTGNDEENQNTNRRVEVTVKNKSSRP